MSKGKTKIRQYNIQGMHCPSCEILLEGEISDVRGVKSVKANRKRGLLQVEFVKDADRGQVKKIEKELIQEIEKFDDYKVVEGGASHEKRRDSIQSSKKEWIAAVLLVTNLLVIIYILSKVGVFNKINTGSSVGFASSFFIGIVASMSSCLAVVGAIIISFSAKQKEKNKKEILLNHLKFHSGRLLAFFFLGGVLGLIGGSLTISREVTFFLTVFIALVMFYMGLNILGLVPSIAEFGVKMPKKLTLSRRVRDKLQVHSLGALLLGASTFFLPCGFTQSMQLYALSTGDFLKGGLSLMLFALGTLPILFFAGYFTSYLTVRKSGIFMKVAGMLVVLFSLYSFNNALAIKGLNFSFTAKESTADIRNIVIEDGKQVVEMDVLSGSFKPSTIVVKKDIPVKWVINGDKASGCTNKIIVPDYDISQKIEKGENVVEFTPREAGTISFSCWMGMVHGKIKVVQSDEEFASTSEESPSQSVSQSSAGSTCDGSCGGSCGGSCTGSCSQ